MLRQVLNKDVHIRFVTSFAVIWAEDEFRIRKLTLPNKDAFMPFFFLFGLDFIHVIVQGFIDKLAGFHRVIRRNIARIQSLAFLGAGIIIPAEDMGLFNKRGIIPKENNALAPCVLKAKFIHEGQFALIIVLNNEMVF